MFPSPLVNFINYKFVIDKTTPHKNFLYDIVDQHLSTCDMKKSNNEIENLHERADCFSNQTVRPMLHQSLTVEGVNGCVHISRVTSNRIWMSDVNDTLEGVRDCVHISRVPSDRIWMSNVDDNLTLTNTANVILKNLQEKCCVSLSGVHTVNKKGDLIYIDKDNNINKLSAYLETTSTFIKKNHLSGIPNCVYWSQSSQDLLVGLRTGYLSKIEGKINRYNQNGEFTKTICVDHKGLELYRMPRYITENNNGDIVVTDFDIGPGAVVVTNENGSHRFSYTGHPSGSELHPRGICTDTLSRILVCDIKTYTIQMIDINGKFLLNLLTKSNEIDRPYCLSYDFMTNRVWVGSDKNNTVCIYQCIHLKDA